MESQTNNTNVKENVNQFQYLSLNEFQKMSKQELEKLVILIDLSGSKENENMSQLSENQLQAASFYQIKINTFNIGEVKYYVTQLIDITSKIHYQKLVGEKSLLQMVNACVSHEMRNPLNAIICQNVTIKETIQSLMELISDASVDTVEAIKRKVYSLVLIMEDSANIQISSTKLMNFFVNDILSLSQINNSNFRKDVSVFDLKHAITEVMNI